MRYHQASKGAVKCRTLALFTESETTTVKISELLAIFKNLVILTVFYLVADATMSIWISSLPNGQGMGTMPPEIQRRWLISTFWEPFWLQNQLIIIGIVAAVAFLALGEPLGKLLGWVFKASGPALDVPKAILLTIGALLAGPWFYYSAWWLLNLQGLGWMVFPIFWGVISWSIGSAFGRTIAAGLQALPEDLVNGFTPTTAAAAAVTGALGVGVVSTILGLLVTFAVAGMWPGFWIVLILLILAIGGAVGLWLKSRP